MEHCLTIKARLVGSTCTKLFHFISSQKEKKKGEQKEFNKFKFEMDSGERGVLINFPPSIMGIL